MKGYSDPLRGMERSMNPQYAQRQMRDPGLSAGALRPHMGGALRPPRASGLGSLHHTMPHLIRRSGMPHFQVGGLSNPTSQFIQSSYAPNTATTGPLDTQYRNFLQLIGQGTQFNNPSLRQSIPLAASFGYQGGGEVDPDQDQEPDVEDVESPDQMMSPQDQQEKQIVLNALAALDGQSPDPEADLKAFIDAFGPRALADLQQLLEMKHEQEEPGEDEEEEGEAPGLGQGQGEPGDDKDQEQEAAADLQGAGGGLLHGRGTGQSDEIEASTPSGRPVLLSDGEYVIDAPTVAALGDGSTKAGARRLDDLRKQIRSKAYGHDKQAKPMSKGGGTAVVLRLK